MLDLTVTAAANSAARQDEAADLIADDATGPVGRFHRLVSTSVFSSNVFADKVIAWDEAGEVLDTRRACIARAGGSVAAGLAEFAVRQGSLLARREGFEDLWEHGRGFVYGAVNIGGVGTERFGDVCVVITDPEAHRPQALAVFPADSLQRYTSGSGSVDALIAEQEATSWSDRAFLAVLHLGPEAQFTDPQEWFKLVCQSDRYLEVVLVARLPVAVLAEVRMRRATIDRLRGLRARRFLQSPLSPTENNEARAYAAMHSWRRAHGTVLRSVA